MQFEEYLNLVRKYSPNRPKTCGKIEKELYLVYDSNVSVALISIDGVIEWIKNRIPKNEDLLLIEKIYREEGILLIPSFDIFKIKISNYEPLDLEQLIQKK